MYLRHFGLSSKPFELAQDPAFYYPAPHQVPMNQLLYAIEERQGLATLIGLPGTGKTTLLRRILQTLGPHQNGIILSDAALEGRSLLHRVGEAFGIAEPHTSQLLGDYLADIAANDGFGQQSLVVLIDEAQGLSKRQLEEVRYLTNVETSGQKLLQIVLAGHPPLEDRLVARELAALRQRIVVRSYLEPLDRITTQSYIEHRLAVAGAARPDAIFAPSAMAAIHKWSGGVPRLINIIAERCLLVGYADDTQVIELHQVEDAEADLRQPRRSQPDLEQPRARVDRDSYGGPSSDSSNHEALLLRLGSHLEALEGKLDILLGALVDKGVIDLTVTPTLRLKEWLESLGRAPDVSGWEARSQPTKKAPPEDN